MNFLEDIERRDKRIFSLLKMSIVSKNFDRSTVNNFLFPLLFLSVFIMFISAYVNAV